MRSNHILQKLRAGEPAFGLWNTTQSPHISRMLAMQGAVDWLLCTAVASTVLLADELRRLVVRRAARQG